VEFVQDPLDKSVFHAPGTFGHADFHPSSQAAVKRSKTIVDNLKEFKRIENVNSFYDSESREFGNVTVTVPLKTGSKLDSLWGQLNQAVQDRMNSDPSH
jgi:hypothetical protein